MFDIDQVTNRTLVPTFGRQVRIWQRYNFDAPQNLSTRPIGIQSKRPRPHRIAVSHIADFGPASFYSLGLMRIVFLHFDNY